MFTNIVSGGNQHPRPTVDTRKTCIWTKWLRLRKQIRQCQENRRHDTLADQDTPHNTTETQTLANAQAPQESEQLDEWERAIREERLPLLARHVTMQGAGEGSSSSSGSMRIHENERWIHVEHASSASHNVVRTRQVRK